MSGCDFVGDNYNAAGTASEQIPAPDANPDDCAPPTPTSPTTGAPAAGGHGTHVSGIVGGNGGGIKGVAPEVKLGAYRVFGCCGQHVG